MRVFKKITAATLAVLMMSTSFAVNADNQTLSEQLSSDRDYGVSFDYNESEDFADVREEYKKNGYKPAELDAPVIIQAANFSASEKPVAPSEYNGKNNIIKWTADNGFIEWKFSVPVDGIYSFRMEYIAAGVGIDPVGRSLLIDGKSFFSEAQDIPFFRLFKDIGKPIVNSIGDEVAPDVEQYYSWQWQDLFDTDASYDGSLQFYLTSGEHTLRMEAVRGDMYLSAIELYSTEILPDYKEIAKEYKEKGYKKGKDKIYFEAESDAILYKNSSTLRSATNGDPGNTPFKYGHAVVNVIGGTMWQGANTAITYKFNVESAGLYAISSRLLMNYRDGIPSYRRISVDGKIPFEEFSAYQFDFDKNWRTEVLSNKKGKPYYIYLSQGEHTLTFAVKQGKLSKITAKFEEDSMLMSKILLKIKMIVGQNPDTNYDYDLEKKIPDLMPSLRTLSADMKWCMKEIEKIAGRKQSKYYQLKSFVTQINALIDDPFIIAGRIKAIEEIMTTYGAWLSEMQAHPLMLDFIEILPDPEEAKVSKSNFFQRAYGSLINFILSYTKDYNNISVGKNSNTNIKDTISLWVSRGTQWCEVMKQMIDAEFTSETGIAVNLNVLPTGQLNAGGANALLLAITSGDAPDVATGVAVSSIGEFAMRNALADVSKNKEFNEIKTRFKEAHFVPLEYKGGIYGLPETQNFLCMVYRKDILSQLGLCIPNTWDEVYNKIIPVINQNNMQFYVPFNTQGYDMFLYQQGGDYFHSDLKTTALDTPAAFRAMKEYTELYTLYGIPQTANFLNRFRSGEMPIGIVDYNIYMTIKAAGADVRGKWGVALIPGQKQEDGNPNRAHGIISAECSMIMEQSDKKELAWKFLKWWSSEKVQLEYANRLESKMGQSARWMSATWNAFTGLSWDNDEIETIKQSFDYAKQPPVVLGGYYVTRHITNAINRVVISNVKARDSIETAVDDINRELQRRRESIA